jgi:flavin reductase (DIM6/NTAB) family NADH-FMN oxidoreductase RutF
MTDPSPPVDQNLFRDVIGRFASGVTIITTRLDDTDLGTTASAVSSLSMDPPMLLVCMNRTSETGQAIHETGRFVVNILGESQADIAKRFATKSPAKFDGVDIERRTSDLPHIARALGHLECRVAETATGGTHTVFLSNVERATATEGSPLTYYRGRFGRFEDEAQEAAYRELRRLVLERSRAAGEPLRLDELAAELDLERPRVQYALMKLTTDGLVVRDAGRGYRVRPLDADTAGEAIDARCAIEVAVADAAAGTAEPAALDRLRRHAQAANAACAGPQTDYEALRSAGRRFHEEFIMLADNPTLLEMYMRLRLDGIWASLLRGRHLNPAYLLTLTDALADGDGAAAKRALRAHADEARALVGEMIARAGGTI